MERITTPTAQIDRKELDQVEAEARQRALEKAANAGALVSEIGRIEKAEMRELLEAKKQGADTAADQPQPPEAAEIPAPKAPEAKPAGDVLTAEQAQGELEARAKKAEAARTAGISATPNAVVVKPDGDMLAVQHDGSRQVGITARGLTDDAVKSGLTERASRHEHDHTLQEIGDQKMELPPTGNAVIDGHRAGFRRLTFREDRSIAAEGGLKGHTPEYHGFVRYADAVKGELKAAGEQNADAMVNDAGYTVAGFQKVHAALARAAFEKEMKKKGVSVPQFANAA